MIVSLYIFCFTMNSVGPDNTDYSLTVNFNKNGSKPLRF